MKVKYWKDNEFIEVVEKSNSFSEISTIFYNKYGMKMSFNTIIKYSKIYNITLDHLTYTDCTKNPKWIEAKKKTSEHFHKIRRTNIENYNNKPKLCKKCSSPISYDKRKNYYCSKKCSYDDRSKRGSKLNKKYCLFCFKEIPYRNKFCSISCQKKQQKKIIFNDIKNNNIENISDARIKEYLIYTKGRICSICGTKEWMDKPIPLVLDHIDGNSNNRILSNYRLVCGNCDMQLPTYKSKNKGNGRAFRRKRYKEGKSY